MTHWEKRGAFRRHFQYSFTFIFNFTLNRWLEACESCARRVEQIVLVICQVPCSSISFFRVHALWLSEVFCTISLRQTLAATSSPATIETTCHALRRWQWLKAKWRQIFKYVFDVICRPLTQFAATLLGCFMLRPCCCQRQHSNCCH